MTHHRSLAALGWSPWFAEQLRARGEAESSVARVAAVDREQLLLLDDTGAFRARLAGRLVHASSSPADLPCVGDWVVVERSPDDSAGRVRELLTRRTSLRRRAAGEAIELQMIAANVDVVLVVQSCHYDFNLNRLERYLVMIREGGAIPWVLLTKTDRVEPEAVEEQVAQIRSSSNDLPVLTLSNVTHEGLSALEGRLEPGKTYCFVGSSGVGKSTLINKLLGRDLLGTGEVSGTGEGRHTTVRRELVVLANGALVIDNPGMRELGVLGAGDGLAASFADIDERAGRCRFRDCTHTGEPGCAVQEAVASGEVAAGHYESYRKLSRESAFHELSYAEKRKKDKAFGRFVKSVKKDLGRD